jgi:hypothetical protein
MSVITSAVEGKNSRTTQVHGRVQFSLYEGYTVNVYNSEIVTLIGIHVV